MTTVDVDVAEVAGLLQALAPGGKKARAFALGAFGVAVQAISIEDQALAALEQVDLATLRRILATTIIEQTPEQELRALRRMLATGRLPSVDEVDNFPLWQSRFFLVDRPAGTVAWAEAGRRFLSEQPKTITPKEVEAVVFQRKLPSFEPTADEKAGESPATGVTDGLPPDLFGSIIGYDDVKDEIRFTLESGRPGHYLFVGPPATAKSLFLIELARLGQVYQAVGSRVSGPGLSDALLTFRPRLLLLDEIDKTPHDVLSVLLSVMESGEVIVTKHGDHAREQMAVNVFAACNKDTLAPELLSRFDLKLYFPPYSAEDFAKVCTGYLEKFERLPRELAEHIAGIVWGLDQDVRSARGIARRLREPSIQDADRVASFMRKYSRPRR